MVSLPLGAADQRGAANRITPAKVLEAKNLITRGTVYQLGRTYEAGMPMFGTRHYSLRIPYVFGPTGTNQATYHDEVISAELGQIGTQFDSLSHIGIGDLFRLRARCTDVAVTPLTGRSRAGSPGERTCRRRIMVNATGGTAHGRDDGPAAAERL